MARINIFTQNFVDIIFMIFKTQKKKKKLNKTRRKKSIINRQ